MNFRPLSSTTIESRKFRIPSDLRRQPGYRPVSSKVGDHLRILLGVVVSFFLAGWQGEAEVQGIVYKIYIFYRLSSDKSVGPSGVLQGVLHTGPSETRLLEESVPERKKGLSVKPT